MNKREIERLISKYENELKLVKKMVREEPNNQYYLNDYTFCSKMINNLSSKLKRVD